jgi:succinoglycan biosynthesis transport protein ExoP
MRVNRQQSLVPVPIAPTESFDVQSNESPGISLTQIVSILRARLRLAVVIVICCIAAAALVTKLLPKDYEATASLIVSYQVNAGGQEVPAWLLGTYISTQIELMKSPEVLLPVIDQLKLDSDAEFISGFRGGDHNALRNYAKSTLDKHLTIEQGRGSQLLYVTASSRDPVRAAQIANAVADVYSTRERQRLKGPADERTKSYSEQLTELQAKVMAAQQKVTDLRQQTGITPVLSDSSSAGVDSDMQTLVSLEQQLLQAQITRRAAESTSSLAPAGSSSATTPQIQELNTEIVTKELQLSQLSATYGARHPKVLELQSDLAKARQSLKEAQQKYLDDTRQMEAQLQRAVDVQREKILKVRKVQDQGGKLLLELESAQSVYKRALDGYDQILFASAGNSTNVSFVSRADVPTVATRPHKLKLLLMGILFGIVCGIASPIVYELFFDRRLHCRDDLERSFGVPVLAEFGAETAQLLAASK